MELIERMKKEEEVFWVNPRYRGTEGSPDLPESDGSGRPGAETEDHETSGRPGAEAENHDSSGRPGAEVEDKDKSGNGLTLSDILEAEARLHRFAPLLAEMFPETRPTGGIIESVLTETEKLREELGCSCGSEIRGRLFVKQDSDLPVAGSVKARGGIYEVLKHTEEIALESGLLSGTEDDYRKLASPEARRLFSGYKVQVGSTGNLGMSIGIMSAALGYRAIVHMSSDAKQWKKDLLRTKGAEVLEYEGDYGEAVRRGRELSDQDPTSYFVDDENSKTLFLGYAVAALRLQKQLEEQNIPVDEAHPLIVYIPCGVGGAPGGICFGLKTVFGENAHVFFAEPVACPCMLLGLATGKHNGICVQDIGLSGKTKADGLACGRPSGFSGRVVEPMLSGVFTVKDERLDPYCRLLYQTEGIFIEPSSCAALHGPVLFAQSPEAYAYRNAQGLEEDSGGSARLNSDLFPESATCTDNTIRTDNTTRVDNVTRMENAAQIIWATGGCFVPADVREKILGR